MATVNKKQMLLKVLLSTFNYSRERGKGIVDISGRNYVFYLPRNKNIHLVVIPSFFPRVKYSMIGEHGSTPLIFTQLSFRLNYYL